MWQIFDLGSYLISMIRWENEKTEIEINAQKRDRWFAQLDSISSLTFEKNYAKVSEITNNLYESDTNRSDLLLKYACTNLCLHNEKEAMNAINRVKSKISCKLDSNWIINEKETMYYALLSESIILNKNLDSLLTKYSLMRKKEWILNDMDSIIARSIYE